MNPYLVAGYLAFAAIVGLYLARLRRLKAHFDRAMKDRTTDSDAGRPDPPLNEDDRS